MNQTEIHVSPFVRQWMQEFSRHNKAMERLEENKQRLEEKKLKSLSWKGKKDELEYKMNLLRNYKELKTNLRWTDEKISQFYPDMQQVVEHGATGYGAHPWR